MGDVLMSPIVLVCGVLMPYTILIPEKIRNETGILCRILLFANDADNIYKAIVA
jgi:hypothetical protein